MTVIGLTGGIASGKSTAAEFLRRLGAVIIDADRTGHRSYEPGTPGFEKVVNAFGHDVVGKDGFIDRRILGGKVFGAPRELERLNAIVWPEIRRLVKDEIAQLRKSDRDAIIVLEAAVLLEAGWQDLCDEVWVVTTSTQVAVDRLVARNGLSEEAAMARISAQMSPRERAEHADVKIDNSGTEEQLKTRVERAWKALLERRPKPARAPAKVGSSARRTSTARKAAAAKPRTPARATARATKPKAAAPAAAKPAKAAPKATRTAAKASRPAAKAAPARGKTAARPASRAATGRSAPRSAAGRPAARASAARPAASTSRPSKNGRGKAAAERRPARAPARRR
jgi:dephospho-CoA kinase